MRRVDHLSMEFLLNLRNLQISTNIEFCKREFEVQTELDLYENNP